MRKALQPYVNQYVLGRGWITDWEEMDGGITRDLCLSTNSQKTKQAYSI